MKIDQIYLELISELITANNKYRKRIIENERIIEQKDAIIAKLMSRKR